uniref:Uncharacterized protein n=1 Tax=Octopus bimaculoides TaxID=37653 RepID=A0A0L8GAH9_OCTBM
MALFISAFPMVLNHTHTHTCGRCEIHHQVVYDENRESIRDWKMPQQRMAMGLENR